MNVNQINKLSPELAQELCNEIGSVYSGSELCKLSIQPSLIRCDEITVTASTRQDKRHFNNMLARACAIIRFYQAGLEL